MNRKYWITTILSAVALVAFAGANTKPGTVVGRAVDTSGKPIIGAKIWVKPVVTTGLYETRTDANGRYEATGLPPVGYRVMGWFEKEYRGQRYCMRLGHPNAAEYTPLNPAKGATRDLVWRLQGRIEDVELYSDMGYFGGSISIMDSRYIPSRNTPIEFTFTPTAPLIDGSQGKTLVRKPNAEGYILDVPVGVYKVTAKLSGKAVQIGSDREHMAASTSFEFKGSSQSCVGSSGSGIERAYLYWDAATSSSTNSQTVFTTNGNDGLISVDVARTTAKDGMAGIWQGTLAVKGGDTYLVRYEMTDAEYGEGYVALEGDFLECDASGECQKIGTMNGKRVPGALVSFTTTLEESGASFDTVGHFEGKAFTGLTDAAFQGKEAVLKLNPR